MHYFSIFKTGAIILCMALCLAGHGECCDAPDQCRDSHCQCSGESGQCCGERVQSCGDHRQSRGEHGQRCGEHGQCSAGSSISQEGKQVKKVDRLAEAKYTLPSTEISFILLDIKNEKTSEIKTIVIDNAEWMTVWAEKIGFTTEPHEDYQYFMSVHEKIPFIVSPEVYEQLSKYETEAPKPEWSSLTPEQIRETFFEEYDREYMLKDRNLRFDGSFLRLLLEKGYAVHIDCESGALVLR